MELRGDQFVDTDAYESVDVSVFAWVWLHQGSHDIQTVVSNRQTGCSQSLIPRHGFVLYVNSWLSSDLKLKVPSMTPKPVWLHLGGSALDCPPENSCRMASSLLLVPHLLHAVCPVFVGTVRLTAAAHACKP